MDDSRKTKKQLVEELRSLRAQRDADAAPRWGKVDHILRRRLTKLQEACIEISRAETIRELTRRTVELGLRDLGFERLGIWLLECDGRLRGAWGTDACGAVRDEHDWVFSPGDHSATKEVLDGKRSLVVERDAVLHDFPWEKVGRGQSVQALLGTRENPLGYIVADNLRTGRTIPESQCELLALYGATIGHLYLLVHRREAEQAFREKLAVLHEVSLDLSETRTLDDLCRRAVEFGHDRLGFERIGIWLGQAGDMVLHGAFGIDEQGRVRDERGCSFRAEKETAPYKILTKEASLVVRENVMLFDEKIRPLKQGAHVVAALSSTRDLVGYMCVDNFFTGRPIPRSQIELLRLYATTVGHLYVRKRAEDALHEAHRRLLRTEEVERRSLASELHDTVAQDLVVLQLMLQQIARRGSGTSVEAQSVRASRKCTQMIGDIRRICYGLYPPMLEQMGLCQSLNNLVEYYKETGVDVSLTCCRESQSERYSPDVEIALYRIAQEAISNAIRHGQARKVAIRLFREEQQLLLCATGDGKGFDPREQEGKGIGLRSMQERAYSVGGELDIRSRKGETRITVRIPQASLPPPLAPDAKLS
jgi:signal transduction histidine kinase